MTFSNATENLLDHAHTAGSIAPCLGVEWLATVLVLSGLLVRR